MKSMVYSDPGNNISRNSLGTKSESSTVLPHTADVPFFCTYVAFFFNTADTSKESRLFPLQKIVKCCFMQCTGYCGKASSVRGL